MAHRLSATFPVLCLATPVCRLPRGAEHRQRFQGPGFCSLGCLGPTQPRLTPDGTLPKGHILALVHLCVSCSNAFPSTSACSRWSPACVQDREPLAQLPPQAVVKVRDV